MKIIVDTLATNYSDEGQGTVLVCLHGWMHSLASFDGVAKRLRDRYRIIRLDLPGFGETQLQAQPWDTDDYARFVAHILQKIGVEPDVMIGHSFGGRIILRGVASDVLHPKKVVLIDTAGYASRNTPKLFFYGVVARTGKLFACFMPKSLYNRLRARLYRHAGSEYVEAGALSQTFLNVVNEKNWKSDPPRLTMPTLILWGEDDTTTPIEDARQLSQVIPDATLITFPGRSHSPHIESADEIADAIAAFI